jgi:hypothetical protein
MKPWRKEIVWSSTRILWDQQMMLVWILLPPIFIACGFLTLVGPYLIPKKQEASDRLIPESAATAERRP